MRGPRADFLAEPPRRRQAEGVCSGARRAACRSLGLGSFDDTAQWDDVRLYGRAVE